MKLHDASVSDAKQRERVMRVQQLSTFVYNAHTHCRRTDVGHVGWVQPGGSVDSSAAVIAFK